MLIRYYKKDFIGKSRIGYTSISIDPDFHGEEQEVSILELEDGEGSATVVCFYPPAEELMQSISLMPSLYIDLDKIVFHENELITGRVVFNTHQMIKALACNVTLTGFQKTKIILSNGKVVIVYKGKKHIISTMEEVWQKNPTDPDEEALKPGTYCWPFSFQLPEKKILLPSYEFHKSHFKTMTPINTANVQYNLSTKFEEKKKFELFICPSNCYINNT